MLPEALIGQLVTMGDVYAVCTAPRRSAVSSVDGALLWLAFDKAARSHPDATAFTDGSISLSYAQMRHARTGRGDRAARLGGSGWRHGRRGGGADRARSGHDPRLDIRCAERRRFGRTGRRGRARSRRPAPDAATRRDGRLHRRRDPVRSRPPRRARRRSALPTGDDRVHRGHDRRAEGGRALARDVGPRGAPPPALPPRVDGRIRAGAGRRRRARRRPPRGRRRAAPRPALRDHAPAATTAGLTVALPGPAGRRVPRASCRISARRRCSSGSAPHR